MVFYEMLTGELPRGRFPPPSRKVQIDVRLDDVVLRSLEREPERRYQQASDVRTDVEAIVHSESVPRRESANAADSARQRSTAVSNEPVPAAPSSIAADATRHTVKECGAALVISGLLHVVALSRMEQLTGWLPWFLADILYSWLAATVWPIVIALTAIMLFLGGVRMIRCESYDFIRIACMLAMVPSSPAWLISMPTGIWSLIVLRRPQVQALFGRPPRARQPGASATPPQSENISRDESDLTSRENIVRNVELASDRVKPASIGLLVAGVFALFAPWVLTAGLFILRSTRESISAFVVVLAFTSAVISCPLAVVIMVGALSMKRLMARWLSLAAAILAVLPLHVAWLITLPLGLWSLVVLNQRQVEQAFRAQTIDAGWIDRQIKWLATAGRVLGILAVVLLTSLAIILSFVIQYPAHVWAIMLAGIMGLYAVLTTLSVLLIVGAGKMRRLESYGWAVAASLLVMLTVIGLPIGLWSLAVLSGRDVRSRFGRAIGAGEVGRDY